jgi:hypothetical protein
MTKMKEFHTCYNNKDVEPMLEAADKMHLYYQNQNVDILLSGTDYNKIQESCSW